MNEHIDEPNGSTPPPAKVPPRFRPSLRRIATVVVLFLLVVFAGGLLLSAAGRVRESAARMACANNMKQLSIAIHSYHDVGDRFPPLVDQGPGAPTGKGLPSVFVNIMPYIEASAGFFHEGDGWQPERYHAHSSVEFSVQGTQESYTLTGGRANRIWRVFLCPSDTTASNLRDVLMTLPDGSTGYYATGSYAANGQLPWGTGNIGKSLPRGSENTVMLAERPQVCQTASGDTIYNLWGVGFYSPHMPAFATLTPTDPPGLWTTGQIAPVPPLPDEQAPDRDRAIQYRIGRADAVLQPLDFPTPIQRIGRGGPCDPRWPGSSHRAGLQVAMADGSVRLFAPDTSAWVFWSACLPGEAGR